ncbi:hypothetical protein [Thauera chlorobenzoica]|uniref:Uncharacterized protein n=1 Tax=Thauera chlorobenzoica TaxID=96773 RepID=A0A1H5SGE3_9RHOO|nr:hypothetical protein [Thauera chlorobenzoica]APR04845.1 hypothetical protein Tchl_1998 [Thauera chlorobenzoica]SEF48827.1 hypothetical protein SAMN05216242_101476 [Thauera chlorobenzoica]
MKSINQVLATPYFSLWAAALQLLFEDALEYARRSDDRAGERSAAYLDLLRAGPMTRRLCRPVGLDPRDVLAIFRRRLREEVPQLAEAA